MAFPVGSVFGSLELNDKFSKNFDKFFGQMDRMSSKVAKVGAVLTAVSAGLGALAMKAVSAAGEWEQTNIAFETLLGGADKAKTFLADMQEFAAKTPFELPGLLDGAKRMMAMGFAAQEVKPMLIAVGDAVAGMGGGADMIQGVTLALGQMKAKQKVSAEEMNQLAERGIPAWKFLADTIGVTVPQAMKMAEKGAIDANVAIAGIVAGMGEKFAGQMEKQSKTFMGQMSTLKDEFGFVLRDIGTALLPIAQAVMGGFQAALPVVRSLAQGFKDLSPPLKTAVGLMIALGAAAGPAMLALAGVMKTVSMLGPQFAQMGVAMTALGNSVPILTARVALMETGLKTAVGSSALLAVGAVALGAAIGITLGNHLAEVGKQFSQFDQQTIDAVDKIGLFEGALGLLPDVLDEVGDNINYMTGGVQSLWAAFVAGASSHVPFLGKAFEFFGKAVTFQVEAFKQLIKDVSMLTVGFESLGVAMFKIDQTATSMARQTEVMTKASKIAGRTILDWDEANQIVMQSQKALMPVQAATNQQIKEGSKLTEEQIRKNMEAVKQEKIISQARAIGGDTVKTYADALKTFAIAGVPIPSMLKEQTKAHKSNETAMKEAREELERYIKAMEDFFEAGSKKRTDRESTEGEVLGRLGPTAVDANIEMLKLANSTAKWGGVSALTEKQLQSLVGQMKAQIDAGGNLVEGIDLMREAQTRLGTDDAWRAALDHQEPWWGTTGGNAGVVYGKTFGTKAKEWISKTMEGLPQVIIGAIQGGGDVGKAIGAHIGTSLGDELGKKAGDFVGKKLGDTLGKAVGSVVPVIGSLLGSFVGSKLGGIVGKIFGDPEKEVNKLRDAFFEAHGGFAGLQQKLVGLTDQDLVKNIFNAKTVEQFNAAVAKAKSLLDLQTEAQNKTDAALQKYGITLDQTSLKFAQGKLNTQAMGFFEEFELMTKGAGVSVSDAIKAMGEKGFTDFVNTARAAGATIPEALRPMVDALIESGGLLDANGEAFGSAEEAGITFGKTVEQSIQAAMDKIVQMINLLLGIPSEVNTRVNVSGGDTGDDMGGKNVPAYANYGVATRPHLAMIGERPEAIVPLFEAMGEGQFVPVTVQVDHRQWVKTNVELHRDNRGWYRSDFNG